MDYNTQDTLASPWFQYPVWYFNEAGSLQAAALAYAHAGLPVLPLKPGGKEPLIPRGVYAATCDQAQIRAWWQRHPQANIGMPAGRPSCCWVLDIDPRHGGLESLEHLQRDALSTSDSPDPSLFATRTQLTGGGGVHLCYHMRDLPVRLTSAVAFAGYPGLDLRVGGTYIVVAPSRHKSGEIYRWQNDLPLSPFPSVLVERWQAHQQRQFAQPPRPERPISSLYGRWENRETDPNYWLRCALKYGIPGQRHQYACFLACHLIDSVGLTPEEAASYLVDYALRVPQDGDVFSVEEALSCLRWAATERLAREVG